MTPEEKFIDEFYGEHVRLIMSERERGKLCNLLHAYRLSLVPVVFQQAYEGQPIPPHCGVIAVPPKRDTSFGYIACGYRMAVDTEGGD